MNFLCGCDVEQKLKSYGKERIEQGMSVCPEHGYPLKGYLSPLRQSGAGNMVIDYSKMRTPGNFVPEINSESAERQRVLRDLDKQAEEILKSHRLSKQVDGDGRTD
jgi:hypothetical protein